MVHPPDPARKRGDGRLVCDVGMLNADIHAAIRFSQTVRMTPCGNNLASIFADG